MGGVLDVGDAGDHRLGLAACRGQAEGGGASDGHQIEWVLVRRTDLDTTIVAGGDLQPTKETMVTCQVEDITDADGTMIVSMVENGTLVKQGDELCRFDSLELEELARQQEILVGQARSACVQAESSFDRADRASRVSRWAGTFSKPRNSRAGSRWAEPIRKGCEIT